MERMEKSVRDTPELHYHMSRVARAARAVGANSIEVSQKDGKVLQTLPRSAITIGRRFRRDLSDDSREDDVEDRAAETKAQIAKIASEVEGMKSESATAKEGVKQLEARIEAEGAEVKRKAALALANKEAELKAEEEKEAQDEEEIEQGHAREEALQGDVEAKEQEIISLKEQSAAEILSLKEQAAVALAAAAAKDAGDVAAERNKTRILLMELTALMNQQKNQANAEIEEDETILAETRSRASILVASLKAQLEALMLKLKQQEANNAELTVTLATEREAKKVDQEAAEVALTEEAELRIHDAEVMGKMLGIAEERLAEKLAKAEMKGVGTVQQTQKATEAPTTAAPKATSAAAKNTDAATPAAATQAATSAATPAATQAATKPVSKKPIKVNLSFEIEPAELENGKQ